MVPRTDGRATSVERSHAIRSRSETTRLLSILDVLCCAFGGILLAFLILLATSRPFAAPAPANRPSAWGTNPPLVILATQSETGGIRPSTALTFEIQPGEEGIKEWIPDRLEDSAHAVLLAERPPPRATVITLRHEPLKSTEPDARLRISVILDGQRFEREFTTRFQHPIPLWPLPKDARSDPR